MKPDKAVRDGVPEMYIQGVSKQVSENESNINILLKSKTFPLNSNAVT